MTQMKEEDCLVPEEYRFEVHVPVSGMLRVVVQCRSKEEAILLAKQKAMKHVVYNNLDDKQHFVTNSLIEGEVLSIRDRAASWRCSSCDRVGQRIIHAANCSLEV